MRVELPGRTSDAFGSAINPAWAYGGGNFSYPPYAVGVAQYDETYKRLASSSDPYDSERDINHQSYVLEAGMRQIVACCMSNRTPRSSCNDQEPWTLTYQTSTCCLIGNTCCCFTELKRPRVPFVPSVARVFDRARTPIVSALIKSSAALLSLLLTCVCMNRPFLAAPGKSGPCCGKAAHFVVCLMTASPSRSRRACIPKRFSIDACGRSRATRGRLFAFRSGRRA